MTPSPPLPWYDTPMRDLTPLGWVWVILIMIVFLGLLWLITLGADVLRAWLRKRKFRRER